MSSPARPWRATVRRRLVPYEGWTTVGLVALLLLLMAWAMESTQWVLHMPALGYVVVLALATALLFSKIKLPGVLLHALSLGLGALIVLWQAIGLLPEGSTADRARLVLERLDLWVGVTRFGSISVDVLPFVTMLVAIVWLAGYLAAWLAFRGRVWSPVVPGGVVLLVTLNYSQGRLSTYLFFYALIALVLVARLNYLRQRRSWESSGQYQGEGVGFSFVGEAFLVALVALVVVWQLPVPHPQTPVRQAWAQFSGPWDGFQSQFNRVFASTTSLKPMPMHTFGDTLPFRGAISLGSQVSLRVGAGRPGYWRGRSYDTYTSQGWRSGVLEQLLLPLATSDEDPPPAYAKRLQVTQRVQVGFDTNLVFAAGEPVSVSLPAESASLPPAWFTLTLTSGRGLLGGRTVTIVPPQDPSLPADLRSLSEELSRQLASGQTTLPRILTALPADLRVEGVSVDGSAIPLGVDGVVPALPPATRGQPRQLAVVVRRVGLTPSDPLATLTRQRLRVGHEYVVTSEVSLAAAADLRAAGTDYPDWVTDRYLQLPESLPKRVRDLALQITRSKDNPYDKAQAIVEYLHGIPYTQDIQPPPYNQDSVDFFLFDQRKGYSDYYGSAMAVLLRAAGIPARVAVGYNTGDFDRQSGLWVVREHHAHAWAEAFFPGYGWIEFEPTPGYSLPGATREELEELDALPFDVGSDGFLEEEEPPLPLVFPATSGSGPWRSVPVAPVAFATFAALGGVVAWWSWRRGLSGLDPAACAYEKTRRLARLARAGPQPQQTPVEFGQALSQKLPWMRPSVERIVHSYSAARYGGQVADATQAKSLDNAWRLLRRALLRRAVSPRR